MGVERAAITFAFWNHLAVMFGAEQSHSEEPVHDVLAAEAFAVPAPDPGLHPHPITPPEDPLGVQEPHDVLAAEEFPMPAISRGSRASALTRTARESWPLAAAAGGLLALVAALLLRRRA